MRDAVIRALSELAADDPALMLLAGDRCYALGLQRLAAEGRLDDLGVLAGAIADSARAHAAGDPVGADETWRAAVRALDR